MSLRCLCFSLTHARQLPGDLIVLLRRSIDEHAAVARGSAANTPQRGVSSFSGSYRDSGLMPHVAYQCVPVRIQHFSSEGANALTMRSAALCRQFLASFLPSLVDEADYAAEFLLLYRHDEEGKPTAAAGTANAETVSTHSLGWCSRALQQSNPVWLVSLHRLGGLCALGLPALMAALH
jgi:hypothetical protein